LNSRPCEEKGKRKLLPEHESQLIGSSNNDQELKYYSKGLDN